MPFHNERQAGHGAAAMTHREQVKAIYEAKQSSLERAAALFTESYLAFVRENSRLLPRFIRRITKMRNR